VTTEFICSAARTAKTNGLHWLSQEKVRITNAALNTRSQVRRKHVRALAPIILAILSINVGEKND